MNLKNKSFQLTNNGFSHSIASRSANFLKIILGIAVLTFIGLTATTDTYAQRSRTQSVCEKNGFNDTNVNLDGIWKLSFAIGETDYEAAVAIKDKTAVSITKYYDASVDRIRRVGQTHRLCGSGDGVIILGFSPVDMDTKESGSDFGYSADNYILTRQNNGKVFAYIVDNAGSKAQINISYVSELPSDMR